VFPHGLVGDWDPSFPNAGSFGFGTPWTVLATSSIAATLGMNGWLDLIQRGLAPLQKRQASLGALTVELSRAAALPGTFNNSQCSLPTTHGFIAATAALAPAIGWAATCQASMQAGLTILPHIQLN